MVRYIVTRENKETGKTEYLYRSCIMDDYWYTDSIECAHIFNSPGEAKQAAIFDDTVSAVEIKIAKVADEQGG